MNRARFVSPSIQDFAGGGYHYNPRQVLSDELGLPFFAVNWTIFNSDPSRAIELSSSTLRGGGLEDRYLGTFGSAISLCTQPTLWNPEATSVERNLAERLVR
jgi:hypothetical protein